MTKLYFVRHGKTEWNLEGRYQGASGDSELLPESYKQIKQLGSYLKEEKIVFDHIYSSPIKRARKTAMGVWPYLAGNPRLTLKSSLKEFALGRWEGQKFDDIKKDNLKLYDAFRNHPEKWDGPSIGAETFEEVIERFTVTVNNAINSNPSDANLLFVSHGAAITAVTGSLIGTALADLRKRGGLSNTSLTILETKDNKTFTEIIRNQTDYLDTTETLNDTF